MQYYCIISFILFLLFKIKLKICISIPDELYNKIESLRGDDLPRSLVYYRLLKNATEVVQDAKIKNDTERPTKPSPASTEATDLRLERRTSM